MASFIHMADVHLGFDQYQLTDRFRDFGTAFRSAAGEAVERSADFVLICGDLFNKRAINAPTLIQARSVLKDLEDVGIPVVVIEGNHDTGYYRDRDSWLSYLRHDGLIILLEPVVNDPGRLLFREWDRKRRRGGYVEIGDARIFGLGWHGASTAPLMEATADAIRAVEEKKGKRFTILMLHAGIEGYVPRMSGCIDAGALAPLRGCVDYIALGHVHKGYVKNDWIFNPGSLETWNVSECSWERGIYHIGFDREGTTHVEHVDGASWRRPFWLWEVSLDSAGSPADAMKRIHDYTARRIGNSTIGNGTIENSTVGNDTMGNDTTGNDIIENDIIGNDTTENSAVGNDTIENDTTGNGTAPPGRSDPAADDPSGTGQASIDNFILPGDTPGRNSEDSGGEPGVGSEDGPGSEGPSPVIHLRLTGVLGFDRHLLDLASIKDHITRAAAPLEVIVKNEARSPDFDFEVDHGSGISREELEHGVVRNLVENDERFNGVAHTLASLIIEIKENPERPPERTVEEILRWAEEHKLMETEEG